jgi:hypothetical protein
MRPMLSAFPLAKWFLRLVLPVIYYFTYKNIILEWNFTDITYLIIFGLSLFSILLLLGGFSKNSSLTVISALLLFIFAILFIIMDKEKTNLIISIFTFVIAFFFMTAGNRKVNFDRY